MKIQWQSIPSMTRRIFVVEVCGLDLQAWEDDEGAAWSVQRAGEMLAKGCMSGTLPSSVVFEPAHAVPRNVENAVNRDRWIRAVQSIALDAASRIVQDEASALQSLVVELSRAAAQA